jgi:hypothetical protein
MNDRMSARGVGVVLPDEAYMLGYWKRMLVRSLAVYRGKRARIQRWRPYERWDVNGMGLTFDE